LIELIRGNVGRLAREIGEVAKVRRIRIRVSAPIALGRYQ
jgi:hypothetical protein